MDWLQQFSMNNIIAHFCYELIHISLPLSLSKQRYQNVPVVEVVL